MNLPYRIRLVAGGHGVSWKEMCIMEAEAFIAGERHTDKPRCVCRVIAGFARNVNDNMTQRQRDELLAPMLGSFMGTVTNDKMIVTHRRVMISGFHLKWNDLSPFDPGYTVTPPDTFVGMEKAMEKTGGYTYDQKSMPHPWSPLPFSHEDYMKDAVMVLQAMIDLYTTAPKEYARDPKTLPCAIPVGA